MTRLFDRNPAPPTNSATPILVEAPLCLVRTTDGKLVAEVDGVVVRGIGHISVQSGGDVAFVQITLPIAAVCFETESDLDKSQLN